ncbi:MAG: SusC/RagA family TonB-linked outer membrane protein, partial [Arachidicoccus sp.]
ADGSVDPKGGPKSGMVRTPQDMAWVQAMQAAGYSFAPVNTIGKGQLYYGDLIYADNNGDGIYGGSNDQKFMNISNSPKIGFGLNLSASWKGLSLSMIWAGASGKDYLWNQSYYNSVTMALGGTEPSRIVNDHYYYNDNNPSDPKNNINGFFPRLKQSDNIDNVASTFWLYKASYIKLKNIQIGYTLPRQLLGKVKDYIQSCNIFLSGENLLTITKYPGPDPEIGTAVTYPLMKQYAFGINVKF